MIDRIGVNSAENHVARNGPIRFDDPTVVDHRPIQVFFDQASHRVCDCPLSAGEASVSVATEPALQVFDDQPGVADLLPLVLDPRELPFGPTERCGIDNDLVGDLDNP